MARMCLMNERILFREFAVYNVATFAYSHAFALVFFVKVSVLYHLFGFFFTLGFYGYG